MKRYITIIILFILLIFTFKNISDLQNHLKFAENESIKNKNQSQKQEILTDIGEHTITFYNLNKNKTASGTIPQHNYTVACDFKHIPKSSYIYIDGYGIRKCEDSGSKIKNKRIDIYMAKPTKELLLLGKQKKKVWIIE